MATECRQEEAMVRPTEDTLAKTLRRSMGVCVMSFATLFQLGVLALGLGHDLLGYGLAAMAAISLFVLMAGWRAHDLVTGKISDMGILFMAYQNGNELVSRATLCVLAALVLAESVSAGLMPLVCAVTVIAVALAWADAGVVDAAALARRAQAQEQTRDEHVRSDD